MKCSEFRYELPPELIAQVPVEPRDSSRLLVLGRASGEPRDARFLDLPGLLRPGDLLVVNDTRVVPARLRGVKDSGGKAEVLLLSREAPDRWEALVRSSKRTREGQCVHLRPCGRVRVLQSRGEGRYVVAVEADDGRDPLTVVEQAGEVPLPPYIRRDVPDPRDRERYQTVYADSARAGSAAAPTAGLHFTSGVRAALAERGVEWASVTLHVGLGTFLPVRSDDLANHRMHAEPYWVSPEAASAVNRALEQGRRVVAVGTTSARVLEHCGASGRLEAGSGRTELFVVPGHEFRVVGGLLTNFHLPESTLLMLVSALAGRERVLAAYRHAVERGYRFYSYGDAMVIL